MSSKLQPLSIAVGIIELAGIFFFLLFYIDDRLARGGCFSFEKIKSLIPFIVALFVFIWIIFPVNLYKKSWIRKIGYFILTASILISLLLIIGLILIAFFTSANADVGILIGLTICVCGLLLFTPTIFFTFMKIRQANKELKEEQSITRA